MAAPRPDTRSIGREAWEALWRAARHGRLSVHAKGGRAEDKAAQGARKEARMIGRCMGKAGKPKQLRLLANWAAELACQDRWRRFPLESQAVAMAYGSGRLTSMVMNSFNAGKGLPYRDSPKVQRYSRSGPAYEALPAGYRMFHARVESGFRARQMLALDSFAFGHPFRLTTAGRSLVRSLHPAERW